MTPRACPLCRIYVGDANVRRCETCDVPLVPAGRLGPSPEERLAWEALPVEERPLPISLTSHGRRWLTLAALVGLVAYALPWLEVRAGNVWIMHGSDFGRRLSWPHACAAAWLVIVPTATSRRTLGSLLAARPVLAVLSATPLVVLAVLYASPPAHKLLHVDATWRFGSWLELAASVLALGAIFRLGRDPGALS